MDTQSSDAASPLFRGDQQGLESNLDERDTESSNETQGASSSGWIRLALTCVGSLLLIVGQFCPMFAMPMGLNVNFFDFSVKSGWVLSKAAFKAMDEASENLDQPREPSRVRSVQAPAEKQHEKPSEGPRSIALVAGIVLSFLALFSPFILVIVAVVALAISVRGMGTLHNRRSDKRLLILGALSLAALAALFLGPMLILWAIPDEVSLVALAASSFGFGWGILLVGCICVLMAGAVTSRGGG
jgi:hypothetical protein